MPELIGLMQDEQLLISGLIKHAALNHPKVEIVTKLCPGEGNIIHRTNYWEIHERSKKLANALTQQFNIKQGQVVGSLAFNSFRHMELYFAVSGIGAVLHTVNPRLGQDQISYIINHGEDVLFFVDYACLPILIPIVKKNLLNPNLKFVLMCDERSTPANAIEINAINYEALLKLFSSQYTWPVFNERLASSLCYTSGTTGNPKGVLFSHRSTILHAISTAVPDVLGMNSNESILVIVPLFHANAWGMVYSSAAVGAKLVFPSVHLDGKSIAEFLVSEKITRSLAVPTVWSGFFEYLDKNPHLKFPNFRLVTIGGSACPLAMIQRFDSMHVRVMHAYGLTETSPLATVCTPLPKHNNYTRAELISLYAGSAGRGLFGVEMSIQDENGQILKWDGKSVGEICLKGPWITRAYFKNGPNGTVVPHGSEQSNLDKNGWFHTGDVAAIDEDGYIHITDRTKDVIKSGGEWISSIDLENAVLGLAGVQGAAVIARRHARWEERPLLLIVRKKDEAGKELTKEKILNFLDGKIPKWWIPDGIEFIETIPLTATGKISKLTLRQQFKDYVFQTEGAVNVFSPKKPKAKL